MVLWYICNITYGCCHWECMSTSAVINQWKCHRPSACRQNDLQSLGVILIWPFTCFTIVFTTVTEHSGTFELFQKRSLYKKSRERTLIRCYHSGPDGPGSDGNEGVLHISQSSSITGTSPSDCLLFTGRVYDSISTVFGLHTVKRSNSSISSNSVYLFNKVKWF